MAVAPVEQTRHERVQVREGVAIDEAQQDDQQVERQQRAEKDNRQPTGHFRGQFQRHAEDDPRREIQGRPGQRRENIGQQETAQGHAQHAGDGGDDGAQGADEAPEDDALAAVLLEKTDAALQQLGMARQGPATGEAVLEAVAQPETQQVAGDGAGHRPGHGGPEGHVVQRDGGAEGHHHDGARHQHAHHRQGFEEGDDKDEQAGPGGVRRDPGQRLVETALVHGGSILKFRNATAAISPRGAAGGGGVPPIARFPAPPGR